MAKKKKVMVSEIVDDFTCNTLSSLQVVLPVVSAKKRTIRPYIRKELLKTYWFEKNSTLQNANSEDEIDLFRRTMEDLSQKGLIPLHLGPELISF